MNAQFWSLEAIKQLEIEKSAIEKKLKIAEEKFIKEHCPYKTGDTLIVRQGAHTVTTKITDIQFVRGLVDNFYGITTKVSESVGVTFLEGETIGVFTNKQIIQHIAQPKNKKQNA